MKNFSTDMWPFVLFWRKCNPPSRSAPAGEKEVVKPGVSTVLFQVV